MSKGISASQNIQLLKWCKESNIGVIWNLLYGFPGETAADYHEMEQLIPLLTHLDAPSGMGSIRLDRFSPNYDRASEFGFANVRADRSYRLIYGLDEGSLDELAYYFEADYADRRDPRPTRKTCNPPSKPGSAQKVH